MGFVPLVGPPMTNRSWGGTRQSVVHWPLMMTNINIMDYGFLHPDVGQRGRPAGARPGGRAGHDGKRLVAGPFPMGSGQSRPKEATWDPLALGTWNATALVVKEPELMTDVD